MAGKRTPVAGSVATSSGTNSVESVMTSRSRFTINSTEASVYGWLIVALVVAGLIHCLNGPEQLQQNHLALGRAFLSGDPGSITTPAYPMLGYAVVMSALGPWTIALNSVMGLVGFALAFRWLRLDVIRPSLLFYAGVAAYAILVSSWNDNSLWLSLVLTSVAILARMGAKGLLSGAAVGLPWGLAYNVRTDILVFFTIFMLIGVAYHRLRSGSWRIAHHGAAVAVFAIAMLPWAIYTTSVLGKYSPTTTNGWGTIYLGLGLIPGNAYGIPNRDEGVDAEARTIGEASAWTAGSNDYFRSKVIGLAVSDPLLVVKRVFWGMVHAARIGVYHVDIAQALSTDEAHRRRLHTIFQDLKATVGLPANYSEGARPGQVPVASDVAILTANTLLRAVLGLAFLLTMVRFALLAARPQLFLAGGAMTILAVSAFSYWAVATGLLFPSDRLNTVLFTVAILAVQYAAALAAGTRLPASVADRASVHSSGQRLSPPRTHGAAHQKR